MNVSLTPELEQYVQERVSSGLYYHSGLRDCASVREQEQLQQIACRNCGKIFRQDWTKGSQPEYASKKKARQRCRQRQPQ